MYKLACVTPRYRFPNNTQPKPASHAAPCNLILSSLLKKKKKNITFHGVKSVIGGAINFSDIIA